MFNQILTLCFDNLPEYAPYGVYRNTATWRNKLTILQNYLTLYASRADYENLPDEFLEITGKNRAWLAMKFFAPCVAWFKDEALGLQCLPVSAISRYNIAGFPTAWRVFGFGYTKELTEENSVLMFNDYAYSIPFLKLLYNVDMMIECDDTHRQNLHAQRQPMILEIEEDEKKSAKTFVDKLKCDDTILVRRIESATNNKRVEKPYNAKAFESGRKFEGANLASDYRYFDNRNLSMLGYENENMEKKERLLVDEVNSNNEVVQSFYTTALDCEKEAFDKINKMFGLNIKVVPRKLKKLEKGEEDNVPVQSSKTVEERDSGL